MRAGDPETQADNGAGRRVRQSAENVDAACASRLPDYQRFQTGAQEKAFIKCPHCGHMQVLEWDNMLAQLHPEHLEDAHFTCIACGGVIEEHHRPQMLAGFEWRARNPAARREHRSFFWSPTLPLQKLVAHRAGMGRMPRATPARNRPSSPTRSAKAYKAQSETTPWGELRDRAARSHYVRGTVPARRAPDDARGWIAKAVTSSGN